MGTRSGDIDPAIIEYLAGKKVGSLSDIFNILNKKSGVLGVSGLSNDMRDLQKAAGEGNHRADLALRIFTNRVKKYIGAYMAEMGRCDAIVFTAGIGENGDRIRALVCRGLESLGIDFDEEANRQAPKGQASRISKPGSRVEIWIIPTNEELYLARDTVRVVKGA